MFFQSFSISEPWLRMFSTSAASQGSIPAVHLSLTFYKIAPWIAPPPFPRELCIHLRSGGYQGHLANSSFSFEPANTERNQREPRHAWDRRRPPVRGPG